MLKFLNKNNISSPAYRQTSYKGMIFETESVAIGYGPPVPGMADRGLLKKMPAIYFSTGDVGATCRSPEGEGTSPSRVFLVCNVSFFLSLPQNNGVGAQKFERLTCVISTALYVQNQMRKP